MERTLFLNTSDAQAGHKIKHAPPEWMSALDVVNDLILLHDEDYRILSCNKAYQQRAGIPFS